MPDSRLLEPACDYEMAGTDSADTLAIGSITRNNACARQNRARYQELQRWTKEIHP